MSLSTFVGSFTVPAATGNKAVTGVGFQPKAIIFWGNGLTSDTVVGTNPERGSHWGIGVSSAQRIATNNADNGVIGPVSADATKCIKRLTGATTSFAADFVSMDADGFTVNFSIANASAFIVNFIAFGGSDLSNAALVSLTSATATGNQATTGAGFKPDALILLGADTSAANNSLVFGMAVSSSQRGTMAEAGNATTGGRIQKTDKCYCNIDGGSSIRCEADLVSLDSDGFTLNWTTANANTHTVYALCLKGGAYKVGAFLQKTSTGSQATTGVGFTPKGLFLFGAERTAAAGLDGTGVQQLVTGAASDATHRAVTMFGSGNFGEVALNRSNCYVSYADDATPTLQGRADLTSFDSDGFTLNFGTADATARQAIYLAVGNATGASLSPSAGSLALSGKTALLALGLVASIGSLGLTGGTPSLSIAPTIASTTALTLSGGTPSLIQGTVRAPAGGALVLSGATPSFGSSNTSISPPGGSLAVSGATPLMDLGLRASAASLGLTGNTPALVIGTVRAPTGATLVLAGATPIEDTGLRPTGAVLVLAGSTPSLGGNSQIGPTAGALALAGQTPWSDLGLPTTKGTLALPGGTPSLVIAFVRAPTAAALSLTGNTPSLIVGTVLTPTGATLTLTGAAPGLNGNITVNPLTGSLALAGGSAMADLGLRPAGSSCALTGGTPTLVIGVARTPTGAVLALSGQTPTLTVGGNVTVNPIGGSLGLTGGVPTLSNTGILPAYVAADKFFRVPAVIGGSRFYKVPV